MDEKILLIDDEQEFTEVLASRMRSRGMQVSTTTSPVEALDKLEEETFDVIILDLLMPEMNGLETLARLKEKNPDLQIILLSGHASMDKGIEAMKLGALDFIEKPIDIKILEMKIKEAKARKMLLGEQRSTSSIRPSSSPVTSVK